MKRQILIILLSLFINLLINCQSSNTDAVNGSTDAVNYRDNFETKSLYELRNNFNGINKYSLIYFYSHFINCAIAEDIIKENSLTDIPKENLVKLIDENIGSWDKDLLMKSTKELDSITNILNKLGYNDFRKEVVVAMYGPYMFYDFSKLDEGNYLLLVNMSGMGASNHYTLLTNLYFSITESYESIDLDNLLGKEAGLLTKKLKGIYSPSFSRHGASLTEIDGKNYYEVYFSEENDPGCCPSITVAIPSFSNKDYYYLDTYYIENENFDEKKPIMWKKLN